VAVFAPDRLDLIKGQPALRRAHLDQLVAALWPARSATRRSYREALAQRNALIARIRAGRASSASLAPWDATLAAAGVALAADRAEAVARIDGPFAEHAETLGLSGSATVSYRSRSAAASAQELEREIAAALDADLAQGHTTRGPHRDELELSRAGRALRRYGSQGEQRLALLALLLAERDALAAERDRPPLLLLDDVMSELDAGRRARLADELRRCGQAVISATEPQHAPGWDDTEVALVAIA
jgi:DNA replication and repair protein RecF